MGTTLFAFLSFLLFLVDHVTPSPTCQVPCTSCNTQTEILDYYWRDYVGIIPPDAIPGGKDKVGQTTYIGQAYIQNYELLPVTIYPGCRSAVTSAYDKELQVDKNIKILCVKNVEKYKWIATKNEETQLLTNCHLVVGGSEVGHSLNIGRINHDGEIIIGKVFSNPLDNRGLWIPYNGHPVRFLSYELLTYNCSQTCHSCDSDVKFDVSIYA